jgi:hypothetical protein
LSSDDFKKKLCQLCKRAGADWVKTSTGYGFVKQPDGTYNYKGATEHDLALMRARVSAKVQVKAAGGVRDLDGLIKVRDLGATRCGASATAAMLDEYRKRAASPKRRSETTRRIRHRAPEVTRPTLADSINWIPLVLLSESNSHQSSNPPFRVMKSASSLIIHFILPDVLLLAGWSLQKSSAVGRLHQQPSRLRLALV